MAFSILHVITLLECFRPLFFLLVAWLNPAMTQRVAYLVSYVLATSIFCNVLNRMGHTRLASVLFLLQYNVSLLFSAWRGGGVYSSAIETLVIVTFWAGFLFSWRTAAFIALANILSGFGMAWFEVQGFLPEPKALHTPSSFWANNSYNIFLLFATQQAVNWLVAHASRAQEEAMQKEKEAKEQVLAMSRIKDDFLTNLSHELRTPLTSITGWAELLKDDLLDSESKAMAVDAIARNAHQQTQLVNDLLDLSRVAKGEVILELEDISVAEAVRDAVTIMKPAATLKNIVLVTEGGGEDVRILVDRTRLRQVLWNILANAVKFSPRGGIVRIRVQATQVDVAIAVQDQGIGISASYLPHIFERFSQEDPSRSRLFGGLGIGLSLTKHYVDIMGGVITVASPGEGQGATFTVVFPRWQHQGQARLDKRQHSHG